jgi:CheY-like chemotaxis protein
MCSCGRRCRLRAGKPEVSESRTFDRCLDLAITGAVTEYARLCQRSFESKATGRLGILAHEVHNCLSLAMLSFETLKGGRVAIGGSTGGVLERSLRRMQGLITRTLASVRIDAGLVQRKRVSVCRFVEDIEVAGLMEASARGLKLVVTRIDPDVEFEVDEPLLTAAVSNVLHNALKFSITGGRVWLRTYVDAQRVRFEIEDECGGLPPDATESLSRPFDQQGIDRTGLGLGLTISQQGIAANGGEIRVRDVPGKGCIFTIDLPRYTIAPGVAAQDALQGDAARPAVTTRRVLVVDDDVDAAQALQDILVLEGHEVRAVHDGPAALRMAPEFQPEIVLLDLGVPKDSDLVARELRTVLGDHVLLVASTGLKEVGLDTTLLKRIDMLAPMDL